MATPDTTNLTDSAQIFTSYTLPQIRAIHKSLHVQIDEKSARLRTQVGTSYRELLGTADTIVQMREDMREAQDAFARMSTMCGRAAVGSKVAGLGKFRARPSVDNVETGNAARLKLLDACRLAVSRLLKGRFEGKGSRLVLAAKTLILSRLLISSFASTNTTDKDIQTQVDTAKKNLGVLRRRLLRAVERVLEKPGDAVKQDDILKVLCAYSLASSSGARDVLRHFLSVRKEAVIFEFDSDEHGKDRGPDHVLRGLDLYTKTLLDVQALVPHKLSDALASLKKEPLLADESLRALEGLRLDVYEKWCGDEIQYFTPFIRHDDLEPSQAKDMLATWAKTGCDVLLSGLDKTLEHIPEFKAIVHLRTSVLEYWIKNGAKPKGLDPSVMLGGLREAVNKRLVAVLDAKVAKLRLVGSEVAATLDSWQTGTTGRYNSLWDGEMLDMDITSGANQIAHEVTSRLYGRNDAVSRAVTCYQSWYQLIDEVGDLVEQLRRQRWDNDVEEIEEEEVIEARQKLLSKDDPQLLHEQLQNDLKKAFSELDEHIAALWRSRSEDSNSGNVAMYMLRILRDIRSQLPQLDALEAFGLGEVSSLHQSLAGHVCVSPVDEFSLSVLTRRRVVGRGLWEGEPALPTHPSPGTFTLLQNLVMAMGEAGLDLWTPVVVRVLKQTFSARLVDVWRKELESGFDDEMNIDKEAEAPKQNETPDGDKGQTEDVKSPNESEKPGEEEKVNAPEDEDGASEQKEAAPDTKSEQKQDLLVQWLYDIKLLQHCLETNDTSPEGPLAKLGQDIFVTTGLDDDAKERIARSCQEYWKRTSLLFGLLA